MIFSVAKTQKDTLCVEQCPSETYYIELNKVCSYDDFLLVYVIADSAEEAAYKAKNLFDNVDLFDRISFNDFCKGFIVSRIVDKGRTFDVYGNFEGTNFYFLSQDVPRNESISSIYADAYIEYSRALRRGEIVKTKTYVTKP